MSALLTWLTVGLPLATACGVGFLRPPAAGWVSVAAASVTLGVAAVLAWHGAGDGLALLLANLVAAAALLAAWRERLAGGPAVARGMAVLAALELAALAESLTLGWVGLAGAMLAVLAGGRGAAGWRGLMAMLPALGLLLFGMLLVGPAAGSGGVGHWPTPSAAAPHVAPGLLSLGFILMVPGLAGCAGLAPLHGWLRDAVRGGRLAAGLVPALAAVALAMLLRLRAIAQAQHAAVAPGPVLQALGLASLLWAAWALWRPGRSAEATMLFPLGLATVAFGLGSGSADAAGLVMLSGAVLLAPLAMAGAGRGRAGALLALALLPPFAPFGAALVLLAEAVGAGPWVAAPLAVLMVTGAAGLARAAVAAWRADKPRGLADGAIVPALILALALAAGAVPAVAGWFATAAEAMR